MKGFPKHINTRKDLEILLGNHKEQTLAWIQEHLDQYYEWVNIGEVETGITDDTHQVIERTEDEVLKKFQLEKRVSQSNGLVRIGVSEDEALELVAQNG